jgi:hypothetical protein
VWIPPSHKKALIVETEFKAEILAKLPLHAPSVRAALALRSRAPLARPERAAALAHRFH